MCRTSVKVSNRRASYFLRGYGQGPNKLGHHCFCVLSTDECQPATRMVRPALTKMQCRTRRCLKKTPGRILRASTLCERCEASILACPVASTCIRAMARF
jgi:hypothetical protein